MSTIPQSLAETARRGSDDSRHTSFSHGRGGAGNMGNSPSDLDPTTLRTPTIKSSVYTTGRGGTGNMAKNTDPGVARIAQDVIGQVHRESTSPSRTGRGGVANVFKPIVSDISQARKENNKSETVIVDASEDKYKGLADRGKEWLFGKK